MRLTLSDLLTAVMVTLLIGTATIAAAVTRREVANRAKCASNLHQIGLAILLYQNENNQQYPRTVWTSPATDPTPTWGTPYADDGLPGPKPEADANPFADKSPVRPKENDVTAPLMLLMRTEQIASNAFVCPSTTATRFEFGGGANTALNFTNFPGKSAIAAHLSYGYVNVYGSIPGITRGFNIRNPDATYAIAGDIGTGGKSSLSIGLAAPADEQRKVNSPNHQQDGQNVLFGDGHVEFQSTVFCGTQHDNIYTAAGPEIKEDGREKTAKAAAAPATATDSVLLPTVADVGTPPPM